MVWVRWKSQPFQTIKDRRSPMSDQVAVVEKKISIYLPIAPVISAAWLRSRH